MPCKHTRGLQRHLLEAPASADEGVWAAHLQRCASCRAEYAAERRALAVFTQLEQERRGAGMPVPSWDRMARRLAGEDRARRRQALLRRLSGAAAVLAVLVGGFSALRYLEEPPQPAHIIQLHPEQRQRLERVLQRSLGDPVPEVQRAMSAQPVSLERPSSARAGQSLRVADENAFRARATHPWRRSEPAEATGLPPETAPIAMPAGGPEASELVHVRSSPVRRYLLR